MELIKQVVSLELAQKLKSLGVKQESIWYWSKAFKTLFLTEHNTDKELIDCSAFTVAELGEMLNQVPPKALGELPEEIVVTIFNENTFLKDVYNPDWIAKCLIYLLENNLITL